MCFVFKQTSLSAVYSNQLQGVNLLTADFLVIFQQQFSSVVWGSGYLLTVHYAMSMPLL